MEQPDRLAALRKGNAEAIRAWAGQYAPKVRDVGLAYLGGPQEAAALAKQVLDQALKAIRGGYSPMDMEEWLLGLARAQGSQAALSRPARPLPAQSPHPILRAPVSPAPAPFPVEPEEPEAIPEPVQAEMPPIAFPDPEPEPMAFARKEAAPSLRHQAPAVPILLYDEEDEASPFEDEPLFRRRSPIKAFLGGMLILILVLVISALLWGLAGLLMRLGLLPLHDLGYTWFNTNIYPFF